jgi:cytidine deaminase
LEKKLESVARKAMTRAYAPYSHLKVGAALLANDGRVYPGCNVENAAFAATICAERLAISSAVSRGAKSIKAIVIVSSAREPLLPCGTCLQTISEFAVNGSTQITSVGKNKEALSYSLQELFPSGAKVNRAIRSVTG